MHGPMMFDVVDGGPCTILLKSIDEKADAPESMVRSCVGSCGIGTGDRTVLRTSSMAPLRRKPSVGRGLLWVAHGLPSPTAIELKLLTIVPVMNTTETLQPAKPSGITTSNSSTPTCPGARPLN